MSTSFFQIYSLTQLLYLKPVFHMIATIAVIAENHFPAIAATTITEVELFISQRSLESGFLMIAMIAAIAKLFFSAITAIVAIIWKPGLSYASLVNKIRFNNYNIILIKQEGCIMLFTYSCFNCRNEKGLLNFVSERIKLVYRINNTRYNFQK